MAMPATCVPWVKLPARPSSSTTLRYSSRFSFERSDFTSLASGLSMLERRSESPLMRDFIAGTRSRSSAGMGIIGLFDGFSYTSKAINAGLPSFASTTRSPKSFVSTPLSHTAIVTGG